MFWQVLTAIIAVATYEQIGLANGSPLVSRCLLSGASSVLRSSEKTGVLNQVMECVKDGSPKQMPSGDVLCTCLMESLNGPKNGCQLIKIFESVLTSTAESNTMSSTRPGPEKTYINGHARLKLDRSDPDKIINNSASSLFLMLEAIREVSNDFDKGISNFAAPVASRRLPGWFNRVSIMSPVDPGKVLGGIFTRVAPSGAFDVLIAFRGSKSANDWKTNFDFDQVAFTKADGVTKVPSVLVSTGYEEIANQVVSQVLTHIKEIRAESITITGHSLGGAVAALVALKAQLSLAEGQCFEGRQIQFVSFGAPKAGGAAFKNWLDSTVDSFEMIAEGDVVPFFPCVKSPVCSGNRLEKTKIVDFYELDPSAINVRAIDMGLPWNTGSSMIDTTWHTCSYRCRLANILGIYGVCTERVCHE